MTNNSLFNKWFESNDENKELKFSDLCLYNYTAIRILESLGVKEPTQKQIDFFEEYLRVALKLDALKSDMDTIINRLGG